MQLVPSRCQSIVMMKMMMIMIRKMLFIGQIFTMRISLCCMIQQPRLLPTARPCPVGFQLFFFSFGFYHISTLCTCWDVHLCKIGRHSGAQEQFCQMFLQKMAHCGWFHLNNWMKEWLLYWIWFDQELSVSVLTAIFHVNLG